MSLIPVKRIERFLTIAGQQIAVIIQYKTNAGYSDPPDCIDYQKTWVVCEEASPDSFCDCEGFQQALRKIRDQRQIRTAAIGSPKRFAEMICAEYELGMGIAEDSIANLVVREKYAEPARFTRTEVQEEVLHFFTYVPLAIFEAAPKTPGIYRNQFSLETLELLCHELEEPEPGYER